jgi:hypothetical protein
MYATRGAVSKSLHAASIALKIGRTTPAVSGGVTARSRAAMCLPAAIGA